MEEPTDYPKLLLSVRAEDPLLDPEGGAAGAVLLMDLVISSRSFLGGWVGWCGSPHSP